MTDAVFRSTGPLKMSRETAENILNRKIIPLFGPKGEPPEVPTYVVVAGQPGSGKSTTVRQAELHLKGATLKLIPDDFATFVPGFYREAEKDRINAVDLARKADRAGFFCKGLVRHAEEMRANIVQEMAPPAGLAQSVDHYRRSGHRTELHVVATPKYQSWTGVLGRLDNDIRNASITSNVLCPRDAHDDAYADWARTVFDQESKKQVDRIVICRRDGTAVYDNELVHRPGKSQDWKEPPSALEALLSERHRPITEQDGGRAVRAWESIAGNNVLQKLANERDEPIAHYQAEILRIVNREGGRRDPSSLGESSGRSVAEWLKRIDEDLKMIKDRSARQFGTSEVFDRRVSTYRETCSRKAQIHRDRLGRDGFAGERGAGVSMERRAAGPAAPGGRGVMSRGNEESRKGSEQGPTGSMAPSRRVGAAGDSHVAENTDDEYGSDPFEGISEAELTALETGAAASTVGRVGAAGDGHVAENTDDEYGFDPFEGMSSTDLRALETGAAAATVGRVDAAGDGHIAENTDDEYGSDPFEGISEAELRALASKAGNRQVQRGIKRAGSNEAIQASGLGIRVKRLKSDGREMGRPEDPAGNMRKLDPRPRVVGR